MSLSPWPFFMDFKGIVPKALTPNFICPISSESRIQPYINTPAQLFLTAIAARLSPNMPHLNEPPASTTRTWKGNETRKMRTTVVINSVTDPGKGPVPAPFIFRPGLRLEGPKNFFLETTLPPYLRVWMTVPPPPYLKVWIPLPLKLINHSCSQKPIKDDHLGQMDESWYVLKHQIKNTTGIWSEMIHVFHLRSNTCISVRCFID